jgi:hypothetical protein
VDVLVVAAAAPNLDGSVFEELKRQCAAGIIRVLDGMILIKGPEGKAWRMELRELDKAERDAVGFIGAETMGLFDQEDEDLLAEGMVPGSAICALAIEHVWAVNLVNAFDAAGVEVAFNTRIPAPIVDEAFALLAAEKA